MGSPHAGAPAVESGDSAHSLNAILNGSWQDYCQNGIPAPVLALASLLLYLAYDDPRLNLGLTEK
jgi:hypothetical protein